MKGPLESRHTSSERSGDREGRSVTQLRVPDACHASIRTLTRERSISGWTANDRQSDLDALRASGVYTAVARGEDVMRTAATRSRLRRTAAVPRPPEPYRHLFASRVVAPTGRAHLVVESHVSPCAPAPSGARATPRA